MQPAEWYGQGDIARMAGVSASARAKVHQVLLRRGWVEKVRNPAFRGILDPWSIMAGAEPEDVPVAGPTATTLVTPRPFSRPVAYPK